MQTLLKTIDLTKKYGNKIAVNEVNMTINKGDIYGFVGKNGAGKTTFMKLVLNLTEKDSGDIILFDNKSLSDVGLKIGSLIESPGLYKSATAYENLKRFSILYGSDKSNINSILKLVGLKNNKTKVKDFSLGMKQRLGIAIALLNDPEILLLDEPINGLDPEGIKDIRDIILKLNKEKNITFLISSHLLDELSKIATKYGIINEGVLVEEIEVKQLKENCKKKLIIEVDDTLKAKKVLEKVIDDKNIIINKNKIEINSNINKSAEFNKLLIKSNIEVKLIYISYDSLEEYFMKRIGA